MAIHVDVELDLQRHDIDRQVQRFAKDMDRQFERVGRDATNRLAAGFEDASPRIERAASKASKAADNLAYRETVLASNRQKAAGIAKQITKLEDDIADARRDGTADADQLAKMEDTLNRRRITQTNTTKQAAKAQLEYADATRAVVDANRDLHRARGSSLDGLAPDPGAVRQVAEFGRVLGGLGKAAGPAVLAVAAVGIVEIGSAAAAAANAVWMLPAALTAVGAGIGTVALAASGFGDAMSSMADPEKFADALGNLSPNAQRAATDIKALVDGPIAELKRATQDAFFEGLGPTLTGLSDAYAPAVQQMTTGIAGALNGALTGIGDVLMQPDMMSSVQAMVADISQAFQNGAPAVESFAQAFLDISGAGASFLPELASGAADLAEEFATFIASARESGELGQWMQSGIDALGDLATIGGSVMDMFTALGPHGSNVLSELAEESRDLADAFVSVVNFLEKIAGAVETVGNSIKLITQPVEGLRGFMEQLGMVDPRDASAPSYTGGGGSFDPSPYTGTAATPTGPWDSLSPADRWLVADAAAKPGSAGTPGTYRRRDGSIGYAAPPSARDSIPTPLSGPYGSYSPPSSGGSDGGGFFLTEEFVKQTAANFGLQVTSEDRPGETGSYHSQGMALDLSNGSGNTPQMEAFAEYMNANFGSDLLELIYSSPTFDGNINDGVPHNYSQGTLNDHRNHVHVAGEWGKEVDAPNGTGQYKPSLYGTGTQRVSVDSFGSSASSTLQQTIGAPLDQDFGFSGGLSGIFENLFRVIANTAMAPVLGALSGVTAAYGTAGPGTGLLGALQPRQNVYGQAVPNIHGSYGQQTSSSGYSPDYASQAATPGGIPGLGSFSPSGAPYGTPASGVGAGPLPGFTPTMTPGVPIPSYAGQGYPRPYTPGLGAGPLATGVAGTDSRGIIHGQGVPASEGIGIGGGLIGAAQSMGGGMGGMGGAAMSAGAQVGIDLINRTIGLGGQLAGNAVGGLMETFLPVESELADPSRGWFGKVLGAVAGVKPAGTNTAGQLGAGESPPTLTAQQVGAQKAKDAQAKAGVDDGKAAVTNNINMVERENRNDYSVAKDIGYQAAKAVGN